MGLTLSSPVPPLLEISQGLLTANHALHKRLSEPRFPYIGIGFHQCKVNLYLPTFPRALFYYVISLTLIDLSQPASGFLRSALHSCLCIPV